MWHQIAAGVICVLLGGVAGFWVGMRYAYAKIQRTAKADVAKKNP